MRTDGHCRRIRARRLPGRGIDNRLEAVFSALAALLPVAAVLSAPLQVKPFERDTVLRRNGAVLASIVAATESAAHREAAGLIAAAIGGEVPVVDSRRALDLSMEIRADLRQQHLVLIGNALENAAVLRLYHLEKARADTRYPGAGGWLVRVLVDPWGTGRNVIIAAGSDAPGTLEAARQCAQAMRTAGADRVLPWGWRFQSGLDDAGRLRFTPRRFSDQDWSDFGETVIFDSQPIAFYPATAMSAAIRAGREYAENGGREEIRRFLTAMREVRSLGDRIEPMRTLEFRLKDLVNAWELMEADPDISPAERQEMAAYLLFVGTLFEGKYWNNNALRQTQALCATTNHISNGNLGYLRLGLYLQRRCILTAADSARTAAWIRNADMLFDAQDDSYRSGCDANGYQWWTNRHMVMYALWRPDYDLFWNGNMRLLADILFATADNLGNAAKFGDVGAGLTGFSSHAHYLLTHGTRVYGDGRQHWISRFLNRGSGDLRLDTPPREPVDLYGVHRVPLSRAIYLHQSEINEKPGWQAVPWNSAFDKISFRANADPASPYLLLDGLGGMGHGHDDCNAITRITAKNHIWLIDAAYDLKTMYDHNGIFVARDGRADAPADLARITAFAELPSFGATRTESPANGLNWARHILWDKSGYFVVLDHMTCVRPGDYQTNAVWRLPVEGRLEDGRLVARQGRDTFVLAAAGDGRQKAAWEGAERALGARAFALRQVVSRHLRKGETLTYANLLCWPDDAMTTIELKPVAASAWAVLGLGAPSLFATRGGIDGLLETDAAMVRLTDTSLVLVNATECRLAGEMLLHSEAPVNLELRADGTVVVVAGKPARLSLPIAGSLTAAPGTHPATPDVSLPGGQSRLHAGDAGGLRAVFSDLLRQAIHRRDVSRQDAAGPSRPPAPVRWRYDGVRSVVPLRVASVTSDIPCMKGRSSPVGKLIDGQDNRSTVSAMWPPDQSPTITFDLGKSTVLDRIEVRSWDGLAECTLGPISLAVSTADTPTAFRPVEAPFSMPRQGERDIARIREVAIAGTPARFVRMTVQPAEAGHRVYMSEVIFHPDPKAGSILAGINRLLIHDLDGDGRGEVLVAGADNLLHCLDADGGVRWTFETGDIVQDMWAGEIDGDMAIFVGSEDRHLYRLDAAGRERWRVQTYDYQPRRYEDGGIRCLTVATLRPGTDPVVIVGADNWHLSLFSTSGKEVRHCYFYSHEATFLDIGDLTGDGNLEIFAGSSFTDVNWFDSDIRESHFIRNRIGPAADGVIADLDGDGRGEMIAVGQLGLAASDMDTTQLWRVNTGSPQTCIAKADLDGDGLPEVISGGKNGFLWAFKADGKPLWRRNAGDSINDLAIVAARTDAAPLILTAGDDGTVSVWNAAGRRLASLNLGQQVARVSAGDLDGSGIPNVLAVTIDGMLHALDLPQAASD